MTFPISHADWAGESPHENSRIVAPAATRELRRPVARIHLQRGGEPPKPPPTLRGIMSSAESWIKESPATRTTERSAARAHDARIEFGRLRAGRLQRFVKRRLSWARNPMPMKHKDCEERNEPATLTERGRAALLSPRKP